MKKILIINGHPSKDGFSSFLSSKYVIGAKKNKSEIKVLNVSSLKFDPIYLGYSDKRPLEKDLVKSQELISWAEHIVFIYPTWWGSMPALMKGFIDRVFASGFAFKYSQEGKLQKLLKGKTGRIMTTAGSPAFYVLANHILLTGSLKYPVLKFCGFGRVKTTVFHTIRKGLSPERIQEIGERCVKLGMKDSR